MADLSNKRLSLLSQRSPRVTLTECSPGSSHTGLGRRGEMTGAGLRAQETQPE